MFYCRNQENNNLELKLEFLELTPWKCGFLDNLRKFCYLGSIRSCTSPFVAHKQSLQSLEERSYLYYGLRILIFSQQVATKK